MFLSQKHCRILCLCLLSVYLANCVCVPGWWNGRHVRLRCVCRKVCGFKSHLGHQKKSKLLFARIRVFWILLRMIYWRRNLSAFPSSSSIYISTALFARSRSFFDVARAEWEAMIREEMRDWRHMPELFRDMSKYPWKFPPCLPNHRVHLYSWGEVSSKVEYTPDFFAIVQVHLIFFA